jgi:hypothetical protein
MIYAQFGAEGFSVMSESKARLPRNNKTQTKIKANFERSIQATNLEMLREKTILRSASD